MKIKETSVNILGSLWKIRSGDRETDPRLDELAGYADSSIRTIVVAEPVRDDFSLHDLHAEMQPTIRHEIIHAFFYESGLWCDSVAADHWAMNEEMIDWFALQLPKIEEACVHVGAMPGLKLDLMD